ncbi:MAG: integrase core domain-containing protein [Fibrobacteraceae bacterium]|nr:integrase core domain-containing protein [Fibrobacteraceae bacterium]
MPSAANAALLLGFLFIAGMAFSLVCFSGRKTAPVFRRPAKREAFHGHRQPKPAWVKREIIRIKAHAPAAGVRQVADIFNRNFAAATGASIGKTFVYGVLRDNIYEVERLRKEWKHRIPKPMARDVIWGMDMTGVRTGTGKDNGKGKNTEATVLGIIDHGTRRCVSLRSIPDKASVTLLKALIAAIERYGKPRVILTDNESVFTSKLFRLGLRILGIRHRRTRVHCPWENGRIERFFGTFKEYADLVVFHPRRIQEALDEFRYWYGAVRPHRHLGGRTPDEAWEGTDPYARPPTEAREVSLRDGLLKGYLLSCR